jgi:cytidine deaminase
MEKIIFEYSIVKQIEDLPVAEQELLIAARQCTKNAYAPYSNFKVGAAALLNDGQIVTGVNQENASYPIGICAERTLISALQNLHPTNPMHTLAISYQNNTNTANNPISPCGMCRQSLVEYSVRYGIAIKIFLAGQTGDIYIINNAISLLPLQFNATDLLK